MISGSAAGPLRANLSRRLRRREQEAETGGGRNSRRLIGKKEGRAEGVEI